MASQTLFITGGSGYTGSVLIEQAIADGYTIRALSRSESSDEKLQNLGATPIRGDLTSLDVLRSESAKADVVINLATAYVFGGPEYETVMPIDIAAIDAMGEALAGSGKPLLITSGTLCAAPDPSGAETTEDSPLLSSPLNTRIKTELHALTLTSKNIRVMAIRLAPYVYGRGGSGVQLFMGMSAKAGGVTCVDGGKNRTTVVHVDDAARLFLLAAQKGKAGDVFNASGSTEVTARQIFDAIAENLGLSVRDLPTEVAENMLGDMVTFFLKAENRASGQKAVQQLGWKPTGMGILDEINKGSYQAVAQALRK